MNPANRHEPSSSFDSADPGSPDTKLTALSPEDFRVNHPPTFSLGAVPRKENRGNTPKAAANAYHDPFVSSEPTTTAVPKNKLSPIAPDFTPLALAGNTGDSIVSSTLTIPLASSRRGLVCSPSSLQSSPLIPVTPFDQTSCEMHSLSMPSRRQYSYSSQASSPSVQSSAAQRHPPKSGQFSSDGFVSRSVVISHVDRLIPAADIESLLSPTKYLSRKQLVLDNLRLTGTVYANFTDIRDAIEAVDALRALNGGWLVQHLSVPNFATGMQQENWKDLLAPRYEGQLLVKAEFSGPPAYFNKDTVGRLILDLLNNYGSIMAYIAVNAVHPVVAYRAEFFDVKDANHAVAHLNGFRIAGCTMSVQPYREDGSLIVGREDTFLDDRFSQMVLESVPTASMLPMRSSPLLSPYSMPSPSHTGTFTPGYFNAPNSPLLFGGLSPGYLVQHSGDGSPVSRFMPPYLGSGVQTPNWGSFDGAASGPGAVGQERHTPITPFSGFHQYPRNFIRHGGRQVPDHSGGHHNVVDVDRIRKGADVRTTIMLRNIPNKIDQAMLKDIVDETSWGRNRFNSDKVAKIFRTGDDSLTGTEEQFPAPDNPSKMRRSVENAEHVGLFAPRAGQNFRDEQRRRRSQYDRGTRLAEIEDSYRFNNRVSRFRHAVQNVY
ncbi:MAG: hypothetical protein Q9200_003179 [Gallowayella weberi]